MRKIKYPKFIQQNETIGITALSAGVGRKIDSFNKSLESLKKNRFNIIETENVRVNSEISSSAEERAKELNELVIDKNISMIMCASGGDFLLEILPYVNYDNISKNPKWIMGASDPSSILYVITTKLDIATLYGLNAGSYDQNELHESLKNNLEILKGNIVVQNSFDLYQIEEDTNLDGYNLTEKVQWNSLNGECEIEGRIIGGCIDVLRYLLGTPNDYTEKFIEKYKDDGIVWYFDIYALSSEDFYLTLLQMKEAGWFKYIKGIIVGRVRYPQTFTSVTYEDALLKVFSDIPTIFNADIGHVSPKMSLINGALTKIKCKDGKGILEFKLE